MMRAMKAETGAEGKIGTWRRVQSWNSRRLHGAKQGPWRVQSGEQGHQNHGTKGNKQNLQPTTLLLDQGKHGIILNF